MAHRRRRLAPLILAALAACDRAPSAVAPESSPNSTETAIAYTEAARRSLAGGEAAAPRPGGTLTQALTQAPDTLHNLLRRTRTARILCERYLFPPLLEVDPDLLQLVPRLAADRPSLSEDGRTMTWRLRDGVTWQQGHDDGRPAPVTTADVLFTWDLLHDPAVAAEHVRATLDAFVELRVIDARTFETVLREPSFRAELDFGTGFPLMPAHLAQRDAAQVATDPLAQSPVGYGPYRLVEWVEGSHITLQRSPAWQEAARPFHLDRLRFLFVEDTAALLPLFRRGELDVIAVQDVEAFEAARQDPVLQERATFHRYSLPQWNCIGWNLDRPWFADVRVRRALSQLYPRQAACDELYHGAATLLDGPLSRPAEGTAEDPERLAYDPSAAKALLDAAGFTDTDGDGIRDHGGRPFEFTLHHSTTLLPAFDRANLMFQQELRQVGILLHLERMEFPALVTRMREHDFDACQFSRTPAPLDDDLYPFFHSSQADGGNNFFAYRSPACDALLEEFRREMDADRRARIERQIDRRIREDVPCTFLWSTDSLALISSRLRGVRVSRLGARVHDWWVPAS